MVALNAKFLRSHFMNPAPQNMAFGDGGMGWTMRLIYEFWGFCMHGSSDLANPGGFSTSHLTGSYLSMPIGFASGSNVLLSSGSDGSTVAGMPYFVVTASAPFSASYVDKWLTMWKSGSTSTDDSIYRIVSWQNSSSISIDPTNGGTPSSVSGSVPQLTSRSDINWRVVDYYAASGLTFVSGNHMVLQFDDASAVNPGQARSQAKIAAYAAGPSSYTQLRIQLSPSGSWDGTQFLGESYSEIVPETINENGNSWGTPDWWHGSTVSETGYTTIIAGTGFIICLVGGSFMSSGGNTAGSMFTIEVPMRLYPAANDPNPICAMNQGNILPFTTATVGFGYAHRFFPSPYDPLTRRWPIMVRSYTGSGFNSTLWEDRSIQSGNLTRWSLFHNPRLSKFVMTDGVLSMPSVTGQASAIGQFSLARAQVRTMRFSSDEVAKYVRIGDDVDRWIHLGGGIMLPWDHSIVGGRPMFAGF